MKKVIAILVLLSVLLLSGCNYTLIDFKYDFDRAIICLPDGTIVEGEIDSWTDYEGEQLQITIDDTTYVVSSVNAVLIKDK